MQGAVLPGAPRDLAKLCTAYEGSSHFKAVAYLVANKQMRHSLTHHPKLMQRPSLIVTLNDADTVLGCDPKCCRGLFLIVTLDDAGGCP